MEKRVVEPIEECDAIQTDEEDKNDHTFSEMSKTQKTENVLFDLS